MYCYDVEGVKAKIEALQNMDDNDLAKELVSIENDLKGYAYKNFKFDALQTRVLEQVSEETWKRAGSDFANALRNGYIIDVTAGTQRRKCPKIKITIELDFTA